MIPLPIRVLVVDDAAVVRMTLSNMLGADPSLAVVGTASNGRIALERVDALGPDVVVLDLEMPVLGGLETLAILRKTHPRLPVVVFSAHAARGAAATVDALLLGASDYVCKPTSLGGGPALEEAVALLGAKIHSLAPARPAAGDARGVDAPPRPGASRPPARRPFQVVVIGSSTGGPQALARLFAALPASFPTPIVVVQHMPAAFTPLLAERLDASSALSIAEARAGEVLRAGHVYIAPGERHTVLTRAGDALAIATDDGPALNSCRPSIDKLLKSAVTHCGGELLFAILTGMGQDGAVGAREVAARGGVVVAQDEATSVVWGMPRAVIEAGVAECTLPLDDIAPEIVRRAGGHDGSQRR